MPCNEHKVFELKIMNFDKKITTLEESINRRLARIEIFLFLTMLGIFLFAGASLGTERVAEIVAKALVALVP